MTDTTVSTGHTSTGIRLNPGDHEYVYGTASTTNVAGGTEVVFSGGSAVFTAVSYGGTEIVSSGGSASFDTVSYGGSVTVTSGGTDLFAALSLGGTQSVLGGSAIGTTVGDEAIEVVADGGTARFTSVGYFGSALVSAGGTIISATVSEGQEYVYAGGAASATTVVSNGAAEHVYTGGVAVSTIVQNAGNQYVSGGSVSFTTVSSGGSLLLYSGGTDSFTTVSSGGTEGVQSGGSAIGATVSDGGYEMVSSGGTAVGATVDSDGGQFVSTHATASFTVVNASGVEFTESGGTTISTTVVSGGAEFVYSGGTASGTVLSAGGYLVVVPGAMQFGTVSSGGMIVSTGVVLVQTDPSIFVKGMDIVGNVTTGSDEEFVLAGGTAISTTVNSLGYEGVYDSGTASGTVVNGGQQRVWSGGVASNTELNSGSQIVYSGGIASFTTVSGDATLFVYSGGLATSTTVLPGGQIDVNYLPYDSGGTATVDENGLLTVLVGGEIYTQQLAGDYHGEEFTLAPDGPGSGTIIRLHLAVGSGEDQFVSTHSTASFTLVNASGVEFTESGGTTISTTVNSGGTEFVYPGGTASSTVLSAGGDLVVLPGAVQSGTVSSGGKVVSTGVVLVQTDPFVIVQGNVVTGNVTTGSQEEYVLTGGTAISTTVNSLGYEGVYDSGTASGTVVNGGEQRVWSGGVASNTELNSGSQIIYSGGMASFTTVSGDATLVVSSGGFATSTTVLLGGQIDVSYLPYTSGGTATVDTNDLLTVSVGGGIYTQQLAGDYHGEKFTPGQDGSGSGTLLTLDLANACYRAGTRILTNRGEVAIEHLQIGDLVRTALSESASPIVWIGHRRVDCARHAKPAEVWPIRVAAGAFGPGQPHTDLFLSRDHAVYVNEVLVPIRHLMNGTTIAQTPMDHVTYFHIELPQHDVVVAQGLPAESYLNVKDGWKYTAVPAPQQPSDVTARLWEAFGCAKLIVSGPELQEVRQLVSARALELDRCEPTARLEAVS